MFAVFLSFTSVHRIVTKYLNTRHKYYYFRFSIQTAAILDFYFRFRFWPFICHLNVILRLCSKFHLNRTKVGRVMTLHAFSKMAAVSHFGFGLSYDRQYRKCLWYSLFDFLITSSLSDLRFLRYCCWYTVAFWLEFAYSCMRMRNIKVKSTSGPVTNYMFGFRVSSCLCNS